MSATGIHLAPEPSLSGLGSLFRYANHPLLRFEDARSFSERAVAFELFGVHYLTLFDPELIESVMITDHASFSKDPFVRDLEKVLGKGLLNSEGEQWRRQRKLAAPSFQRSEMAAYADQMTECAERFVAELPRDRAFDVHEKMMHLTLDILVRTLFGTEISRASEVEAALDGVMREYSPFRITLRTALPDWATAFSRKRIARLRHALDAVLLDLIRERKSRRDGRDLLSRLLAASDASGGMSETTLRDETMTLFLAGHETTALALTYALRLLALHPEAKARAVAEVKHVLGARSPRFDDIPALPWVRAVIDETLRLFPPAWAVAREAQHDCLIGDLACPKGTELMIVPWVMHRDQRWFDQPELFRPERWLPKADLPRCVYMPFGAGPRVCIGNHFALTEAILILATCLARADFQLAQGPLLRLTPAVTLRPSGPVRMRALPR